MSDRKYKILMIGLGSIGQRHVRNLKRVLGNQVEFLAYRVRRLQQTFSDTMQIRDGINLEEEYAIRVFDNMESALKEKPDIVFVTNITSKHMECALEAAKAGCNLFLEKPLSHTWEGVEELQMLQKEKGIHIFLGYQNRYHPCVARLRELLDANAIGQVVQVEATFEERLTTMHTYEDYSTTYMALAEMGGGPVLNLQIHDLDYLQWIFGMPTEVTAVMGKNSRLKIDVEDHAVISYKTTYQGKTISVTSCSNFLSYPPKHICEVIGDEGRIILDFNKAEITLYQEDGEAHTENFSNFQRNDMFITELRSFLSSIENNTEEEIPLTEGIKGLQLVLMAKKAGGYV
ncbi:MAG: Gfo/Idh/MocA family oxidoreductase [Lachnospiraceae bacterium]|nr:Gfo/Idh/MocA family oxidoreductase [Lachnospiraceae bacterium]